MKQFLALLILLSAAQAETVPQAAAVLREITPLSVRGVNYFPRDTPWGGMWTKTPPEVFEQDMALAASLGCNTIRTFLQFNPHHEQAGLVAADGAPTQLYHERFEQLLAAAWRHGIRVLACFEFAQPWLGAAADARWRRAMTGMIEAHRGDGRVLMWDLMNEPDDDAKWTDATRAYLGAALPLARQLDTNHLTTVGLAWRADRLATIGLPDIMQYHEYAGRQVVLKSGTKHVLIACANQRRIGGARPLLIGEFGMSTARDDARGVPADRHAHLLASTGTEAEQTRLYEIVLAAAEEGRLAGAIAWCLHDYPIRNPNESHFGLVRTDGSLKPASDVLRAAFTRWSKP